MLKNPRKLLFTFALFFCVTFLFGCLVNVKDAVEIATDNGGQLPMRRLRITIEESRHDELFEQFHKFAEEHGFEIEISDYGSDGEVFQVWMLRDQIKVIAMHTRFDPEVVSVGFYDQERTTPVSEETMDTIDDLIMDFENLIKEIPGVMVIQQ